MKDREVLKVCIEPTCNEVAHNCPKKETRCRNCNGRLIEINEKTYLKKFQDEPHQIDYRTNNRYKHKNEIKTFKNQPEMDKIAKQIAALEAAIASPATPDATKAEMKEMLEKLKAAVVKAEPAKKDMEKAFGKEFMASKDKGTIKEYPAKKAKAPVKKLKEYFKDKQSGEIVTESEMLNMVDEDDELDSFYSLGEFESKAAAQKHVDSKTSPKAKQKPAAKAPEKPAKKASKLDYDCDELIDREKKRKAKIKEAAAKRADEPKKTPATKNKETIAKAADKVEENVFKRIEKGEVSKSELKKLITETEALLAKLKAALKKL